MGTFHSARNDEAVARGQVPLLAMEAFRAGLLARVRDGARVAALFALPGAPAELWAVLANPDSGRLLLARGAVEGRTFVSLTPELPELQLFEREIFEQHDLLPLGHPWLKAVRFPPGRAGEPNQIGQIDFYQVEGDEVHEVAVGPVHAGVIEPGHFRFQCHGEEVLHLEISLGYQHRGVERALVGGPNKRSLHFAETLAGDTTAAHTTAYCQALEALAGCVVPPRALALRGVAIELERLANHTGDLGALAGDVGYLPTASFCGRLRGDWLNLTAQICGNRFGRGLVVPGGVGFRVDAERATAMIRKVDAAMADLQPSLALLWDTPSVMARFEDTGRVTQETAQQLGLVGLAARASGLERDARVDFPTGIYQLEQIPLSTWTTGDVFARAWVRALEADRSSEFIKERLAKLPAGAGCVPLGPLAADHVVVSLMEGWRGEVCHVAITDSASRFAAYKVVDPSFHNWMGLALALRGQQISDFPLCNKSFNLSYCGFDL